MPLTKMMLRVALWSLAVSGGALVMAILTGGNDFTWRAAGSAFVTALAAGAAVRVAHTMEHPPTRIAGLTSMGVLAVAFPLGLTLIWMTGYTRSGMDLARLWGTWWVIVVGGPLIAACLAGLGHDRHHWRWIGVAAGIINAGLILSGIWGERYVHERWFLLLGPTNVVVAIAVLSFQAVLKPGQYWVRHMTIIAAVITGAIVSAGFWSTGYNWEGLVRFGAASGIVAIFGALGLAVLTRINAKPAAPPPESGAQIGQLVVECPCCALRQRLPAGDSACAQCGLVFAIRMQEPRCTKCEYNLLYRTKTGRCAECGEVIPPMPVGTAPGPAEVVHSLMKPGT